MQEPSRNVERVKSTDTTNQRQEGQKAPKRSSHTKGHSTLRSKEPSQARPQMRQHLSKNSKSHHTKLSVLSGPPNPPKGEIDHEKLVVNVPIELAQESVNALSESESPFETSKIYSHGKGPILRTPKRLKRIDSVSKGKLMIKSLFYLVEL